MKSLHGILVVWGKKLKRWVKPRRRLLWKKVNEMGYSLGNGWVKTGDLRNFDNEEA